MGQRGELWVVTQAVLLVLLIVMPAGATPWPHAGVFRLAGGLCVAFGVLLLVWSARNLGHALTPFPRPAARGTLVTHGAYGIVRHPIYLGVLSCCLGLALLTTSLPRLGMTLVLLVFFDRKAHREEGWLIARYPGYVQYQKQVRKLLPWIY